MTDADAPGPWVASSRRQADEWALVLTAAGIPHRVEQTPAGWTVSVAWHDRDRAAAELAQFERWGVTGLWLIGVGSGAVVLGPLVNAMLVRRANLTPP